MFVFPVPPKYFYAFAMKTHFFRNPEQAIHSKKKKKSATNCGTQKQLVALTSSGQLHAYVPT
jgi:hypothetical protein